MTLSLNCRRASTGKVRFGIIYNAHWVEVQFCTYRQCTLYIFHIVNIVNLQDTLYVVLDTNVLLSHLKLISELKDFPIEGKLAGCMYRYV